MKKVFALCGALLFIGPAFSSAASLTVQVQQAQLRSEPSFVGKILANVPYRSAVEVVEEQGAWRLVNYKGQQGWMHNTALLTTSGKLSAGLGVLESAVSSKEVSLAGKGFDKNVENAYKKAHGDANFAAVDRMEKINISSSELEKFAAQSDFSGISR